MEFDMIFAIGYDLLQKELAEQELPYDVSFILCREIYDEFLLSEECQLDMREYEALQIYIKNNKWYIDNIIGETGSFLRQTEITGQI